MKREIKFRAWNIPNKTMYMDIQNGVLCQNEKGQIILGTSFGTICKDSGSEIMQFTGLKDKNRVEIYEGDILKHSYYKYLVGNESCDYVLYHTKYKEIDGTMLRWVKLSRAFELPDFEIEVIGNIHQNPELLS